MKKDSVEAKLKTTESAKRCSCF